MFMSCHQTTEQNHYIKVANKSSENVAKFKYLGLMSTNQNYIHEEIKSRLNSRNACYHEFEGVREQGAQQNIWTKDGWSDRRPEKTP
jgi:hypothetical protein